MNDFCVEQFFPSYLFVMPNRCEFLHTANYYLLCHSSSDTFAR